MTTLRNKNKTNLAFKLQDNLPTELPSNPAKFNSSIERKIERVWLESKVHGWNYAGFVAYALEVLTILHQRKKVHRRRRSRPYEA